MSAVNKKHFQRIKELFQEKAKNDIYNFSDIELQEMKDTIDLLCSRGVLRDLEMDNANAYWKIGDFSIFDEWLNDTEAQKKEEQKAEHRHDYCVAIVPAVISAILTAVIAILLFLKYGIGG